jgi:hypothetical protein
MRIIAWFNLKPNVSVQEYEAWARSVDIPTVTALESIEKFEVMRTTGVLGSEGKAPYEYVEIIDVKDMQQFGVDVSTPKMQQVAADFRRMVDVTFVQTEKVG